MTRPRLVRLGIGLAVLGVLIGLADAGTVWRTLTGMHLGYFAAAMSCIAASTALGAANAFLFIARRGEIGFLAFLPIFWMGWAFSLVVPGQIGDIAAIAALLRRRGLSVAEAIGRSGLDKLLSLAVNVAAALAALTLLPIPWEASGLTGLPLGWTALGAAAIAGGVYAASRHPAARRALETLAEALREALRTAVRHPNRVLVNALLTVVKVALIGSAYYFALRAAGAPPMSLLAVIGVAAASSLVAYLPITLNGIGTVELAGVVLFATLGAEQPSVLAAYLALRAGVMVLAWIPAGLWWSSVPGAAERPARADCSSGDC